MSISPLFEQYDPYGTLQEQARLGMLPGDDGTSSSRRPAISDLMPEEEKQSLLSWLANKGTTGLAAAGYILDTPGAFVRGVLAGDPLSVFGDSERRVSGRDLLRQYGMVGSQDNWRNFAGGVLAEAALDPLTYASLGLSMLGKGQLGQAGRAAQAAGLLRNEALDSIQGVSRLRKAQQLPEYADAIPTPRVREYRRMATPEFLVDQISDQAKQQEARARLLQQLHRFGVDPQVGMKQPVGVLDNIRVPGTNVGFEIQGGALGDTLARSLDSAGNWTKTAPVIGNITRTAAALVDPSVGGLSAISPDLELTNYAQIRKRLATAGKESRLEDLNRAYALLQQDARSAQVPASIPSGPLAGKAIPESLRTFDSQELWNALRDYATSRVRPGWSVRGITPRSTGNDVADWVLENVPEFRAIRDRFTALGPDAIERARAAGLSTPVSQSRGEGGFFPRQIRRFLDRQDPTIPGGSGYKYSGLGRDARAFSVQDNFGRGRDPAYDLAGGNRAFRYLTAGLRDDAGKLIVDSSGNPILDAAQLQQKLIAAQTNVERRQIVQQALDTLGEFDRDAFTFSGSTLPYKYVVDQAQGKLDRLVARKQRSLLDRFKTNSEYLQADAATKQALVEKFTQSAEYTAPKVRGGERLISRAEQQVQGYYDKLTDLLMNADQQYAKTGTGIFDNPSWQDALRYERGQAENLANAEQLTQALLERADEVPAGSVPGGQSISLTQAAAQLGYDVKNFKKLWQTAKNSDVSNFSIPKKYVDALRSLSPQTRLEPAAGSLVRAIDNFTNAFKVGALAYPGFHVRNMYSGAMNAATQGAFNPFDYLAALRASQGDYSQLVSRLRDAPGYTGADAERLRKFLAENAAQRVSGGNAITDIAGGTDAASVPGLYIGSGPNIAQTTKDALYQKGRSYSDAAQDYLSLRGSNLLGWLWGSKRAPRPTNTNPLLALNDAVGSAVEDTLRTGTFLNQVRKGVDPGRAGDLTRLTQVDYSPSAFTSFERDFLKRLLPFYSFQKGIIPSIADNVLYRPGGLQGQSIRAVSAASRPSGGNVVPERFRRSSAIPLPYGTGEGLQRYLTKIDAPWESTLNLFTPGVGADLMSAASDTVAQTGSNLIGMLNPLVKAPIEFFANRQFYSGRDLSDAFSVLEDRGVPGGRTLEQIITNFVPFGSRGLSTYRQLTDDRLDPYDAATKVAINYLSGMSITDENLDKATQRAARNMLNKILESTPGVRTYENITVPPDVLATMPEDQRRMYLLYKVIQSDAAKRARQRKKDAMDPMELLGAVR